MTTTNEPVVARPMPMPSVHLRALATWLTIFPLVAIGMTVMALFAEAWHPVIRAFVLTLIVVPLAVYVIVPRLISLLVRLSSRR